MSDAAPYRLHRPSQHERLDFRTYATAERTALAMLTGTWLPEAITLTLALPDERDVVLAVWTHAEVRPR